MIDFGRGLRGLALGLALAAGCAASARAQSPGEIRIGYLELSNDARYDEAQAYARLQLRPLGRPFAGAEVALAEGQSILRVVQASAALERFSGGSLDEVTATVQRWASEGAIHFVVADLPGPELAELARRLRDSPVLILNASAPDDDLRGAKCQPNLLHVYPSQAMQSDAVAQFLVSRKWGNVLVLQGPKDEDARISAAFKRSAAKFGLKIADTRSFELTNDPRQREQSNVSLMTGGADYDVVFVADSEGEFARSVPYQTQRPRPVLGSTGLVAEAWHWSWERNGGPQLNSRFEKHAGRRMTGHDWAAWAAVKAVVQAAVRTNAGDFRAMRDFLLSDRARLDGVKGSPMGFRSWDGQLRQPLLLATHNAVIERAPLRGFLHRVDDLDTLGLDQPESPCKR